MAVETTETHKLLREHAAVAIAVVLLGIAASAVLAWFVARHGLAPLAQVATRAEEVTAQRLGARLDLKDAPEEVHGLADSINRMLRRIEDSFRTLEQFSADIAHELRTPLNNLLLQTQVTLSRSRSAEEYQEALHSNLMEIERLQKMISAMLFLARADRGMIELNNEDIEVAAEARSVAEYFEAVAAEKRQTITIAGEAQLRGDRMLLRRALTNLLSNAVRYAPEAAPIRVSIESEPGNVSVAVSNPEGVGLGLAIVESIMKAQGGGVNGRSEGNQVTFTLRFPG